MDAETRKAVDKFHDWMAKSHQQPTRPITHGGESRFHGYWEHNLIPGQRVWVESVQHLDRLMKQHGKAPADDIFKMKSRASRLEHNKASDAWWRRREQIIRARDRQESLRRS